LPRRPNASTEEILALTVQLIAKHDISGVTVDMVAEKAGVSKATIYRRWASRNALILDAITFVHRPGSAPDTGSLQQDLSVLLNGLVEFLNRRNGGKVFAAFLNEAVRNPRVSAANQTITSEVRASYETVISRAIERGELRKDINVQRMIDILIAPFLYRRLVDSAKADPADVQPIIEIALKAFG
jgi:AcrR family transcriptional regulator